MEKTKSKGNAWEWNGCLAMLQTAFIVLRLCGVIDWGWKWVLSPLWMYVALLLLAGFIIGLVKALKND